MTTVVVGDIGGHYRVFEQVLAQLGVGDDGVLPGGVRVIQVGDMVRFHPDFLRDNGKIVRRLKQILAANSAHHWVQLVGNHESEFLNGGGDSPKSVASAIDSDSLAELVRWWQAGRLALAAERDGVFFSHAGLTRGRWEQLGRPGTAAQAAAAVNRDVGKPIALFSTPGRLVTQQVTPNVDTLWAEVNFELLLPWIEHQDAPFDQVHGHAAPFRWNTGDWWPETPEVVKQHTVADPSIRRSVTTLGSGRTLTGVDWVMEHTCPDRLWPLLRVGGDWASGMLGEVPQLWRGPGVLFSVSSADSGRGYAQIAGPRSRIAAWEQRWEAAPDSFLPSVDVRDGGDVSLVAGFRAAGDMCGWSFELDVSWNDDVERQQAMVTVGELLPPRLVQLVESLPQLDVLSINENRQVALGEEFADLAVRVLDMPINSLPSTRRRSRDLVLGVRWVRLVVVKNGLIALWHPVSDGNWTGQKVPWPHNAVPSRAKGALTQLRSGHIEPEQRQAMWLADTMTHERYFYASWVGELEQWQDDAFQWLTDSLTMGDVNSLREDLGLLSKYLTATRWTQRALVRRVQETRLGEVYPHCADQVEETAEHMAEQMPHMRRNLAESFDILSTISQRVQEDAANEANAASERLNWLITLFTAVLFVPTVVSGIYGANIEVLSDGAKGSLWELIALMVGLALLSFGLLNIVSKRWGETILGVVCGVSMVAVYEIPARVFQSSVNIIWATLPMVVFLLGIGVVNTVNRRRT